MLRDRKVLILGGTKEAREIADILVSSGLEVTTSLAGVTEAPAVPSGRVRIGGFGGSVGLRAYLTSEKVAVLIDATHPYAAQISRNVQAALTGLDVWHLRLQRPAWRAAVGEKWIDAKSAIEAALVLPDDARVMLTIGRKEVAPFIMRDHLGGCIRSIEAPEVLLPPQWQSILERPPFTVEAEVDLMERNSITHLVSKNAGSAATAAKLEAARLLGVQVVMIDRPIKIGGTAFTTAEELVRLFAERGLFQRS